MFNKVVSGTIAVVGMASTQMSKQNVANISTDQNLEIANEVNQLTKNKDYCSFKRGEDNDKIKRDFNKKTRIF